MICPPAHGRYGVALWSKKGPLGTWGSMSATVLSLKALVSGAGGGKHKGLTPFTILVNGKEVKQGEVTQASTGMLQMLDFKEHMRPCTFPRSCRFHVCGRRPANSHTCTG